MTNDTVLQWEARPEVPGDDASGRIRNEPSLDGLLETVFGLQPRDVDVNRALLDNQDASVNELAGVVDLNRSNVQRHLNELRERGLVRRRRRLLNSGGQFYQYTALPPTEARDLLQEAFDDWAEQARDRFDEFLTVTEPNRTDSRSDSRNPYHRRGVAHTPPPFSPG